MKNEKIRALILLAGYTTSHCFSTWASIAYLFLIAKTDFPFLKTARC